MNLNKHNPIQEKTLARINTVGGDVFHVLKCDEPSYKGFGEAYFSIVECDFIKAWKCHHSMVMNLIVPVGNVKFVFFDQESKKFEVFKIGENNYSRLTVPSNTWFGFQGLNKGKNLILNLSNIKHDEKEISRKPLEDIDFNWYD